MKKLVKVVMAAVVIGLGVFGMNTVTAKAEEVPVEQVIELNDCKEPEGPVEVISIEDIEFASEEEALAYFEEHFGLVLPIADNEVTGTCLINLLENSLQIGLSTSSNIGTASSIGVKDIYIQYSSPGSNTFGNKLLGGTYYKNNASSYNGLTGYDDLQNLYSYRVKLTHFIVVGGIEYRYSTTSNTVTYFKN